MTAQDTRDLRPVELVGGPCDGAVLDGKHRPARTIQVPKILLDGRILWLVYEVRQDGKYRFREYREDKT